jgi:HK97 family phage prohead protease
MRYALASTDSTDYLLELRSDPKGLHYYAKVAPVSYANDLRILMKGGVIKQASFAFTVAHDSWEIVNRDKPDEYVIRTIHEIGDLFDVTITAQGAYPQTDSQVVRAYASTTPSPAAVRRGHGRDFRRRAHAERGPRGRRPAQARPRCRYRSRRTHGPRGGDTRGAGGGRV